MWNEFFHVGQIEVTENLYKYSTVGMIRGKIRKIDILYHNPFSFSTLQQKVA